MPISALPAATIRLLGSAIVIADPADLVKELIENSLDAEATSVKVTVSPNVIDKVEVRDNGHGIPPQDYDSLGRPGHTSKLVSIEELRAIGGKTLGFRGQALASANSLGTVKVTTKTANTPTAVRLGLCRGTGGIETHECTSASIGTTVSVTALFGHLPVRKQVAEKEAAKNLAKIQHLLCAYALARPQIRLSLQIGGQGTQAWSYSPRAEANVKEAAMQLFGISVTSQYVLKTLASKTDEQEGAESSKPHDAKMTIQALLPKPDADLSKLSKGFFCSVDSRLISALRGTGKKLLTTFRAHFQKCLGWVDRPKALKDVFLSVNICCPPGSYDPNVDPSKNEVIFANETQLVSLFERLCSQTYVAREAFFTTEERCLILKTQTYTPPPSSDHDGGVEARVDPLRLEVAPPDEGVRPSQSPDSDTPTKIPFANNSGEKAFSTEEMQTISQRHETLFNGCAHQSRRSTVVLATSKDQGRRKVIQRTHNFGPLDVNFTDQRYSQHEVVEGQNVRLQHSEHVVSPQPAASYHGSSEGGFVVDMSADPDLSTDEEAEVLASCLHERNDTGSEPRTLSENPKEELNPWTIAKMTGTHKQTWYDNVQGAETARHIGHRQIANGPFVFNKVHRQDVPILRPHEGPLGGFVKHQILRRRGSPVNPCQTPGAFYHKKALEDGLTLRSGQPYATRRPTNPVFYCVGANDDLNSELTRGPGTSQEEKDSETLHIDEIPSGSRVNAPLQKVRETSAQVRGYPAKVDIRTMITRGTAKNEGRCRKGPSSSDVFSNHKRPLESPQAPGFVSRAVRKNSMSQQLGAPWPDAGYAQDKRLHGNAHDYLVKRKGSEAMDPRTSRLSSKRQKSEILPLEMDPVGQGTRQLTMVMEPDVTKISRISRRIPSSKAYQQEASFGDKLDLQDVEEIKERLSAIVSVWMEHLLGEKQEVRVDLRGVVKGITASLAGPAGGDADRSHLLKAVREEDKRED